MVQILELLYTNTYSLKIVPNPLGTIRYNWYNFCIYPSSSQISKQYQQPKGRAHMIDVFYFMIY